MVHLLCIFTTVTHIWRHGVLWRHTINWSYLVMVKNSLINSGVYIRVPNRIILQEDRTTGILFLWKETKSIGALVYSWVTRASRQTDPNELPSHSSPGTRVVTDVLDARREAMSPRLTWQWHGANIRHDDEGSSEVASVASLGRLHCLRTQDNLHTVEENCKYNTS